MLRLARSGSDTGTPLGLQIFGPRDPTECGAADQVQVFFPRTENLDCDLSFQMDETPESRRRLTAPTSESTVCSTATGT